MEENTRAEPSRSSDLPALTIYSVVVFLLMLAWVYFPP
jgi:hypothetical protein